MIVKTPGSQMGSPAVTEEGGEEVLITESLDVHSKIQNEQREV